MKNMKPATISATAINAVIITATIILLFASCNRAQELQTPNVVVFLVDDMGLMDTSVPMLTDDNGKPQAHPLNDWYQTPNMERLAFHINLLQKVEFIWCAQEQWRHVLLAIV